MPWVLWDIVVPLVLTFAIGLATGWLLWRWRRFKAPVQTVSTTNAVADEQALSASSATALIEERDIAIARADEAELRAQTLAERLSQATDTDEELLAVENPAPVIIETDEQVEQLNKLLADERSAKSALEQAFMDLNNRHAALSGKLDDAMDEENAAIVKDAAAMQSKYEQLQQELADTSEKLHMLDEQHKAQTAELQEKLGDTEVELADIKQQKDEVLAELEATRSKQSQEEASDRTDNVHHMSSYSRGDDASGGTSVSGGEPTGLETSLLPAVAPSGNSASDTRVAMGGALNSAANAVATIDDEDIHEEPILQADVDEAVEEDTQPGREPSFDDAVQSTASDELQASEVVSNHVDAQSTDREVNRTNIRTTASGYRPQAWEVPERTPDKSEIDNLQKIKGVGPVLEKLLHKTGIFYFRQVALLDSDGVTELDAQLPQFSGRIQRDNWVEQSKVLHQEKYGAAPDV